jgi:hypothetical protein
VPLLWKSSFKIFLDSASWACVRSHQPGAAGVIAARRGRDASEYARIYYLGLKREEEVPEWTTFKLSKVLLVDSITLVATGITIYQACTLTIAEQHTQFLGSGLWAFPTLPSVLVGFTLLAGERTGMGGKKLLALVTATLVLAGVAVALVLWKFQTHLNVWFWPIVVYGVMVIPLGFCEGRLFFLTSIYGWFGRVGAIGITSLQHHGDGLPWCKLKGPAFGAVYMAIGGIAAILASIGAIYHSSASARPGHGGIFDRRTQMTGARGR